MPTVTGIVEMYKKDQGYGFIKSDGDQIFAHQKDIIEINGKDAGDQFRCLNKGEEVSFEVVQGDKGLKAINIKVLTERQPYERNGSGRSPNRSHNRSHGLARSSSDDIVKRLVEVLSDENTPDGPLLTRSEALYILTGHD